MDLSSPQVISFCNTKIRPTADQFAQMYHNAKAILAVHKARGLGDVITLKDDTPIPDGADVKGNPVITAAMVTAFISGLQTFVDTLEADDNKVLNLVLQVAPNP